ncbi:hypothetical protein [Streptomyces sp. SLBN-8D4]|jgi:hypothetical protein|uniref:hypothetical protein n=1 Tax=Streptomyces sp. SLBN-8D4 TaxID=3377728 RepID=UPI003C7E042F
MTRRIVVGQSASDRFAVDVEVGGSRDDQLLQIMLTEVADLTKAMREFLMTADRFVNFTGIIAVGALTIGGINHDHGKNWLALVFAPYGLAMAFAYLIQVYTEVEKRAGYKKFLEYQINQVMGKQVLLESQINSQVERNRLSVQLMQRVNGIGFLILVCLSGRETFHRYSDGKYWGGWILNLSTLNIVFLCFATYMVVQAGLENKNASSQAYENAQALYGTVVPTSP